jgi:predicted nucleotidyltransferase
MAEAALDLLKPGTEPTSDHTCAFAQGEGGAGAEEGREDRSVAGRGIDVHVRSVATEERAASSAFVRAEHVQGYHDLVRQPTPGRSSASIMASPSASFCTWSQCPRRFTRRCEQSCTRTRGMRNVRAIAVFGSLGRGDWRPDSDLDLDVVITDDTCIEIDGELRRLGATFATLIRTQLGRAATGAAASPGRRRHCRRRTG